MAAMSNEGIGCKKDVLKAVELARRAIYLDPFTFCRCNEYLLISADMIDAKKAKEAVLFLLPLAVTPRSELAWYQLAYASYLSSQLDVSLSLARPLALQGNMRAIHLTMLCCRETWVFWRRNDFGIII